MFEKRNPEGIQRSGGPQFKKAMAFLEKTIIECLDHGFFDCSITSEVVPGGKRQVMIRVGKSHKFTIPEEDLPS
jgi:hypothetical protein